MLGAAIIVFREVLEAALIIGIVLAATQGVKQRNRWVIGGVSAGVFGACVLAAFAGTITAMADGVGQELMQAGILLTAVMLIAWHVVWMNSHGRALASELQRLGHEIVVGARHMSAMALVIGLAVLREGSEIVLLLQGLTGTMTPLQVTASLAIGLISGAVCGYALFKGFTAMPVGKMFTMTNWVLILIAAGMAARGVNFLAQAGLVPSLGEVIWDTSALLSEDSFLGQMLVVLVGYMAQPSGIQLLAYVATAVLITGLMIWQEKGIKQMKQANQFLGVLLAALAVQLFGVEPAKAEYVSRPFVSERELEIEHSGLVTTDNLDAKDSEQEYEFALSYGVTSWYKPEFEVEYEGDEDSVELKKYKIKNLFQLTDRGEYWLDVGFRFDYTFGQNHEADGLNFGPILAASVGPTDHVVDLFYAREVGEFASEGSNVKVSTQSLYSWQPWLKPGVEMYWESKAHDAFKDQSLKIGPAFAGKIPAFTQGHSIKYEAGYLFGATKASPDGTLRWKLEYEMPL